MTIPPELLAIRNTSDSSGFMFEAALALREREVRSLSAALEVTHRELSYARRELGLIHASRAYRYARRIADAFGGQLGEDTDGH